MRREKLVEHLRSVISINGHILGVAVGSGMSANCVIEGGADMLLALSAGKYRQFGQSAFSGFLGYDNSNELVYNYAKRELFPMIDKFPIIFGLFMQDPCIYLYEYLQKIQRDGFSGVINYPSVGFFGGKFRKALEEAGMGFEREIEGIRIAHFLGLFTIAYVFDIEQAVKMVEAGVDVICVHFGITGGGIQGANKVMPLEIAMDTAQEIFDRVDEINPEVIKMVCGGPVQTPVDTQVFYQNTKCQGYLGGSSVERVPIERSLIQTVKAFKSQGDFNENNIISRVLNKTDREVNYAQFMKEYIKKNYQKCIRMKDLSSVTNIPVSRLSILFKEAYGITFTDYLIQYRMNKAKEYMEVGTYQMKEIASMVGYDDYTQFSKMFKKVTGFSPAHYQRFDTFQR